MGLHNSACEGGETGRRVHTYVYGAGETVWGLHQYMCGVVAEESVHVWGCGIDSARGTG